MSTWMVLRTRRCRSRNARRRQGAGRAGGFCRWSFGKPAVVGGRCRFHTAASARSEREIIKPMMTMKKNVLALLLDETPLTKAILSRAFKKTDYEVLWTANVNEALEALVRQRVDLLLVDLNRPLRKEWEIFERLIARNHGVPMLILTDHKSAYEEAAAEHVGAVLQKPFSSSVLVHTVTTLLDPPSSGVEPLPIGRRTFPRRRPGRTIFASSCTSATRRRSTCRCRSVTGGSTNETRTAPFTR